MVNIIKTLNRKIPCYFLPDYRIYIIAILFGLMVYHLILEIGEHHFYLHLFQSLSTIITAGIIDGFIIRFISKEWYFPTGAIISAILISMIINPENILLTNAVIIISLILKYTFRPNFRNVFNPAVLAIVISTLFLPIYSTWHGSVGYSVFILGFILAILIKRLSTALSFFLVYSILNLGYNFFYETLNLSLTILTGPIVFFAFFMVIEPVTTPITTKSKIIFGTAVAILTFIFSFSGYLMGNSFFLYLSLLVMNLMMRVIPRRALQ